jgi:hypothetical protein
MVVAFEFAATVPYELTVTMFHISLVRTGVFICSISTCLLPVALSMLHAVVELTRIHISVGPSILPEAFSLTPAVLTHILISNSKDVHALSVSEAGFPFTFVLVLVTPSMLSKPVWLVCSPLTDIVVTSDSLPDSVALLVSFNPLALVELSALPYVLPLAPYFARPVLALVSIAIGKVLIALAMASVIGPMTFIYPARIVNDYTSAFTFVALGV